MGCMRVAGARIMAPLATSICAASNHTCVSARSNNRGNPITCTRKQESSDWGSQLSVQLMASLAEYLPVRQCQRWPGSGVRSVSGASWQGSTFPASAAASRKRTQTAPSVRAGERRHGAIETMPSRPIRGAGTLWRANTSAPQECRPSRGVRVRHSCLRGFTRHRVTFVRPAYAASTSHRVT
jgi:hypothetical protein